MAHNIVKWKEGDVQHTGRVITAVVKQSSVLDGDGKPIGPGIINKDTFLVIYGDNDKYYELPLKRFMD